ncbi:hypothetical protein CCYA_CCYA09G2739 [Cyanidiococcus yangmingshanensis]|uniref:DNA-directed RNA polymerase subunit n=1 Tax=Cyanidiococcus yangmingshanensis TaxID=2690220 RepID=A0A7J7IJ90_9RHOD|nr:RNA polymerase III C11 subunit [Cyanidiococcus yangmingshanensis]KAK4531882.1 hypothetical protein CCYA_CCYA09G2739 [Cyanidiococcus yangmingshanensis]
MLYCPLCYERVHTVRYNGAVEGATTCFQCEQCGYRYALPWGRTWAQPVHPWAALNEQEARQSTASRDRTADPLLLGTETPGQETSQVRCERCGARRASFYQLQTRSADEPMTTFYRCLECGNQWRE